MIKQVWRITRRLSTCEIGHVPGGYHWTAHRLWRLHSSVCKLPNYGTCHCGFTCLLLWRAGQWHLIMNGGLPEAEATFWGHLLIMRMKGRPTIMRRYSPWWLLYTVYAVLDVCCTRCRLYSVSAVLSVCSTRYMQYLEYAIPGVFCSTPWQLMIKTWRDRQVQHDFEFCDDTWVVNVKARVGG
jgi:hypothetical protein